LKMAAAACSSPAASRSMTPSKEVEFSMRGF
jgi:hypothetical protein